VANRNLTLAVVNVQLGERRRMTDPPDSWGVDARRLVRDLGYDPAQLTPMECEELADILAWDEMPGGGPTRR
jgi:hypothetical protein